MAISWILIYALMNEELSLGGLQALRQTISARGVADGQKWFHGDGKDDLHVSVVRAFQIQKLPLSVKRLCPAFQSFASIVQ